MFPLVFIIALNSQPIPETEWEPVQLDDIPQFTGAINASKAGATYREIALYRQWLDTQLWQTDRLALIESEKDYCDYTYRCWDIVDDMQRFQSNSLYRNEEYMLARLSILRHLIGYDSYYRGNVPLFPEGAYQFVKPLIPETLPMPH